jgi:hypothetical protein
MAIVKKDSRFGLITKNNTTLINSEFDSFHWVNENILRVEKDGKGAYFNCKLKNWIWKEE